MKHLYIIGTGSQARYVIEICKKYKIKGLIGILNKDSVGNKINGIEIKGFIDDIEKIVNKNKEFVIIAYGDNKKKKELVSILSEKGFKFATVISDKSYISSFVEIGNGCIINPGVIIMPNTKVGDHVIIHSRCVIEHDNNLENFVNIAPGVSTAGNVSIGEGSYVYTGAVIIPKVKIGKNVIVGAGSVVLKDVKDNSTVVGVPAKMIKRGKND